MIDQNFVHVGEFTKVSREFSSQKFGVFLESFPKTIRFYLETSGVRRDSPKMYEELLVDFQKAENPHG